MSGALGQLVDYLASDQAWSGRNGLPALAWSHVRISLVAVVIAGLLAVPAGVLLGHARRGAFVAMSIVNVGRAIPSFAILALLLPFSLRYGFGLGFWPTIVALVLLAVPPVFTNAYTGVREVPHEALEAARGMGMRGGELLRRVEVPVAVPLILTGLRVSSVQVIATATLGALVGYRNLGTPIVSGFTSPDKGPMLASAAVVALLALAADALFALTLRRLVPWRRPLARQDDVTVTAGEIAPGPAGGPA
ncbi:MAG TPA: ABC transporter permease [Acidimicrobiales bacterium]|nr:ABC transporter permease [Acidimicrobiales bacterium]